jgi:UDP-N-acetylmuramate dehydrogenase
MYTVELDIRQHVPMRTLTSLRVGGAARFFSQVHTREAVAAAVAWAADQGLPLLVIGRGSNLVVADAGFPGLVLRVAIRGSTSRVTGDSVALHVGAGEVWNSLVTRTVARNWAGLECLAGIPGLVGAGPVQNIGAYGQEISDTITAVEAFDLATREVVTFSQEECVFGYRTSRFRHEGPARHIILGVHFRLRRDAPPTVQYVELERDLKALGIAKPSLHEVRQAVLAIRARKSMLIHPSDPNARSAGSFFTNPLITATEMAALDVVIARLYPNEPRIPRFEKAGQHYKIPAAWLIERSGFARGHTAGPVGLSSNHALAIINRGGATTADVLHLARAIRDRVFEKFGVMLTPEPVMIGVSLDDG